MMRLWPRWTIFTACCQQMQHRRPAECLALCSTVRPGWGGSDEDRVRGWEWGVLSDVCLAWSCAGFAGARVGGRRSCGATAGGSVGSGYLPRVGLRGRHRGGELCGRAEVVKRQLPFTRAEELQGVLWTPDTMMKVGGCVEDATGGRLAQPFRAFPTGATFGFAYLHHYAGCRVALEDNADLDQ